MTKLPSIPGIRKTDGITVQLSAECLAAVEQRCRTEWLDLHHIEHQSSTASPLVPMHIWQQTTEGKMHTKLMNMFFNEGQPFHGCPPNHTWPDVQELNRMWTRLQSRRYEVRGTRAKVDARARNATAYRKFRSWWVDNLLAEHLGLSTTTPCPFEKYVTPKPPESYIIIGEHFEEWTDHILPPQAWKMLKEWEVWRLDRSAESAEANSEVNQGDTNA